VSLSLSLHVGWAGSGMQGPCQIRERAGTGPRPVALRPTLVSGAAPCCALAAFSFQARLFRHLQNYQGSPTASIEYFLRSPW
jgi:hypothetical protein